MFKNFKFRAGQRIIKTSVSAAAAMMISNYLELDFPSLAIIAAIVILQPTFHETIDLALKRLVGTVIGCSLALLCVYYLNIDLTIQVLLGTFILLTFSSSFAIPDAGVLGIIAFVSIITDPAATVEMAVGRLANTSIGASTSIIMNYLFPVQPIEIKFKELSFNVFNLNLKLLCESLRVIAGSGRLNKNEFDNINDEIIVVFDEVYKLKTLMLREIKYVEAEREYSLYLEKFDVLWEIHSNVMQIYASAANVPNISDEISAQFLGVAALFETAQKQKNELSSDIIKKIEYGVNSLDEIVSSAYVDSFYSEIYEEGSFLAIITANLKRLSEMMKIFEADAQK